MARREKCGDRSLCLYLAGYIIACLSGVFRTMTSMFQSIFWLSDPDPIKKVIFTVLTVTPTNLTKKLRNEDTKIILFSMLRRRYDAVNGRMFTLDRNGDQFKFPEARDVIDITGHYHART
jgi:hypothetical protein